MLLKHRRSMRYNISNPQLAVMRCFFPTTVISVIGNSAVSLNITIEVCNEEIETGCPSTEAPPDIGPFLSQFVCKIS